METCPHCKFLVRDGARVCGVCHKPLAATDVGVPSFLSGDRHGSQALAAHVGPGEAGVPVSVIVLFVVGLLFALALVVTGHFWM